MRATDSPMTESYRGETFEVKGIERYACDACGDDMMSGDMADRLARELAAAYAHAHGLLSPTEIREVRKSLSLRQSDFERMLGVSSPTCSRWETGSAQQSRTADRLMRVIRDVAGAAGYLMSREGLVSVSASFSMPQRDDKPAWQQNEGPMGLDHPVGKLRVIDGRLAA